MLAQAWGSASLLCSRANANSLLRAVRASEVPYISILDADSGLAGGAEGSRHASNVAGPAADSRHSDAARLPDRPGPRDSSGGVQGGGRTANHERPWSQHGSRTPHRVQPQPEAQPPGQQEQDPALDLAPELQAFLDRVVEADTKLKQQSRAAGGASASSRTSRGVPFTHQMTAAEATAAFLESQKRQQGQTRPAAPSKPPTKTRTGISANGGTDGGASSTPARLRPLGGRGQAIAAILEGRLGRAAASTATAAAATTTGGVVEGGAWGVGLGGDTVGSMALGTQVVHRGFIEQLRRALLDRWGELGPGQLSELLAGLHRLNTHDRLGAHSRPGQGASGLLRLLVMEADEHSWSLCVTLRGTLQQAVQLMAAPCSPGSSGVYACVFLCTACRPQLSRPARTLLLGALQEAGGADWELRGPLAARLVQERASMGRGLAGTALGTVGV
eukprot:XP_001689916.1 predicted protein [Chlamydomonas reinhardtii]